MTYPDGSGLSAAGRARREKVRLQRREVVAEEVKPGQGVADPPPGRGLGHRPAVPKGSRRVTRSVTSHPFPFASAAGFHGTLRTVSTAWRHPKVPKWVESCPLVAGTKVPRPWNCIRAVTYTGCMTVAGGDGLES